MGHPPWASRTIILTVWFTITNDEFQAAFETWKLGSGGQHLEKPKVFLMPMLWVHRCSYYFYHFQCPPGLLCNLLVRIPLGIELPPLSSLFVLGVVLTYNVCCRNMVLWLRNLFLNMICVVSGGGWCNSNWRGELSPLRCPFLLGYVLNLMFYF